jgi:hypothetical protein
MASKFAGWLATVSAILANTLTFADAQGSKPVFAHFMVSFPVDRCGGTQVDAGRKGRNC